MGDYYTAHRDELKGKPKRTIADYVKQQGIPAPRCFDSLAEARASGLPILVRSEHAQDYDGVSGLLRSVELSPTDKEEMLLLRIRSGDVGMYCRLLGLKWDDFKRQVSFSLWEKLEGYNRAVIADTAIWERYHIFTSRRSEGKQGFFNYTIVEGGEVIFNHPEPLPPELQKGNGRVIDAYEKVRHLSRFDPQHCPVVEMQTVGETDFFLQYLRTRDFQASPFVLDRPPGPGEVQALLVRGATPPIPPEGKVYMTIVLSRAQITGKGVWGEVIREEEGAYTPYASAFAELMYPRRQLQVIDYIDTTVNTELMYIAKESHSGRSPLFKPELSVLVNTSSFMSRDEFNKTWDKCRKEGLDMIINLHVISDGRKAYVKRV